MVVGTREITMSVFVRIPQQVHISQFFHALKVEHFCELIGSKIQSAALGTRAGSLGYIIWADHAIYTPHTLDDLVTV